MTAAKKCRDCKNFTTDGMARCEGCREKNRKRTYALYWRQKAAGKRFFQ